MAQVQQYTISRPENILVAEAPPLQRPPGSIKTGIADRVQASPSSMLFRLKIPTPALLCPR